MRCTQPPSCLLSLRSTYTTLLLVGLIFLVSLLSSPSTAQSAVFDPTKRFTVQFAILLDVSGSIEPENLTDVNNLFLTLKTVTAAPSFFVYFNASSGLTVPLSVTYQDITRDTVCDPIKSSLAAYDVTLPGSNIAALIGPPCSASTESSLPIAAMNSLPQISYGATDDLLNDITRFSWLVRTVGNDAARAGVIVEALLEYGWTHFSVILQKSSFGVNVLNDLTQAGENNGLTLVSSFAYYAAAPNWTAIAEFVVKRQQQGSHVFVVAADDATCQHLLLQAWQRGLMGPGNVWIAAGANCVDSTIPGSVDPAVLALVTPGVLFVNHSFNASTPQYSAFLDTYALVSNATYTPIVPYENLLLYDTMMTLAYGFKNLFYQGIAPGLKTGAALLSTIIQNVSFVGVTGPVSYSHYDQTRLGVQYGLYQVNRSGGVVNLATAAVSGQTFTYDMTAIPTYNFSLSGAAAYWQGTGQVPLAWTPPPTPEASSKGGISISTQVLTVIICIACLVGCCIMAGVSFVALWRAKTTKVMDRLSQALADAERARRNEAEAYKAKSQFLAKSNNTTHTQQQLNCATHRDPAPSPPLTFPSLLRFPHCRCALV